MRFAPIWVAIGVVGSAAIADAAPDLRLKHEPPPRSLRMRPRRAAQATGSVRPMVPRKPAPIATPPQALPVRAGAEDLGVRDVKQPVSFTLNVGYQVDATQLSDRPTINGTNAVNNGQPSFQRLRSYGFGEGFLSTRGVGVASLSTYFALRFQAARDLEDINDPSLAATQKPSPIATWFERSGTELRTGWLEIVDFLPEKYGFKGVRVRVGDQFIYGPWIMHVDGLLAAWETRLVRFQAYYAARHSDYTRDLTTDNATIYGGSARIDLRELARPVPIALAAESLTVGPDVSADTRGSRNLQLEVDWRPKPDFALIGKVRQLNGETANERLEFRGRYKQVSNLVFDLVHRRRTDWQWDPALGRPPDDETLTARRYLDLGPVMPQLVASLRGGTLLAENLDLSVRGAFARDLSSETSIKSSNNASYVEGAAALQVRLRRTIAFDASVLSRQNALPTPIQIVDTKAPIPGMDPTNCDLSTSGDGGPTACQPLPDPAAIGERGFTEVGAALRMSLGARRFSAAVEVYTRRTRYAALYANSNPAYESDVRGGGRFTIDAWVGSRIRLYAAYDLSSRFEFAPELTGYKSLRLIMAGTY
ncbi:MAG: hypothetical protein NT062_38110 [Proteobacteria bacterium]|nr:hypothetical protein [Pseudomonadota bacterium]